MRPNKGKKPPRYRHKVAENKSLWYRWNGIKKRCLCEHDARYHEYGGRGIRMCAEWQESFDNFADWALANGFREDLTIERVDVNGDYCPENCCWIPRKEQAFNKRDTIWINYHGRKVQLKKLCDEKGLHYDAIHNRIVAKGWDHEKAIDTPLQSNEESLRGKCLAAGVNYNVVRDRINKLHWSEAKALSTPTGRGRSKQLYAERNVYTTCVECGTGFYKHVPTQRFCSETCREKAKRRRKHEQKCETLFFEPE